MTRQHKIFASILMRWYANADQNTYSTRSFGGDAVAEH